MKEINLSEDKSKFFGLFGEESYLPDYGHHLTDNIIKCGNKLMFTIKLDGVFYTSYDDRRNFNFFNEFKSFLQKLGKKYSGLLSIQTHIIRSKDKLINKVNFNNEFMKGFSEKYYSDIEKSDFYKTEYFITFGLKYSSLDEQINDCNEIISSLLTALDSFNPSVLGLYYIDDIAYSEITEFLIKILTNKKLKQPILAKKIKVCLAEIVDIFVGYDVIESRLKNKNNSDFSVCYDLLDFPNSKLGMWDFLLDIKFEFILTQSFIFLGAKKIKKQVLDKKGQIQSFSSSRSHQVDHLENIENHLDSGDLVFGDHHCSIRVFGESVDLALKNGSFLDGQFSSKGRGTVINRSLKRSFYSLLSLMPLSKYRPLSAPMVVENLADSFSLHNFFRGKSKGNPIGDGSALMPFKTINDNLYYLNTFTTNKSNVNSDLRGDPAVGHTLILGASGFGKTVLECTLVGWYSRFNPKVFAIDYNESTHLLIRSLGGEYFNFIEGEKTGINPFKIKGIEKNKTFLYKLIEICAFGDKEVSAQSAQEIKSSVDGVLQLDYELRVIDSMLSTIEDGDVKDRIKQWCKGGRFEWVFANDENKFDPSDYNQVGFDVSSILRKDCIPCYPLLLILFYFKKEMQKGGQLLISIIAEFWLACNFTHTAEEIKSSLKAGRARREIVFLDSQTPEDALNSKISVDIIQMCQTQILLGNPNIVDIEKNSKNGELSSYYKLGNLKSKDLEFIRDLSISDRSFLLKQESNVAKLRYDISGYQQLPILTGDKKNLNNVFYVIKEELDKTGDFKYWLPIFYKANELKLNKNDVKILTFIYVRLNKIQQLDQWLIVFYQCKELDFLTEMNYQSEIMKLIEEIN